MKSLRRDQIIGWVTLAVALAAAAVLGGCANPRGIAPTEKIDEPTNVGAVANAQVTWPREQWWKAWGDAQLDQIVNEALGKQPNLKSVEARLKQAQAAVQASRASELPQVGGSVDLAYQRISENGLFPPPLAGSAHWNNDARVTASWEFDLFGRNRALLDAAIGQWRAAQADGQAARVLLASNVIAAYVNLARWVESRELMQQGLAQREQVLDIVRQRTGAGLDTKVDLRQAEGAVAQTRVEIEALNETMMRTRHALAELVGVAPDRYDDLSPRLGSVRPVSLPSALPADLVGRRADVVALRWRVEAASRDVAAARAQFYPNINLTAFVGLNSLGFERFVREGSREYGYGPALRLPIFEGGKLRANLAIKSADVDLAIGAYNNALLRALREVADEISSLQAIERQQHAQQEALSAAEAAFDLSMQRYRSGLGNFLVVLTADANVIVQRRAASDLKARYVASEVALTRALGGGFEMPGDWASSSFQPKNKGDVQ